jgi:hypothetical protein
MTAFEWWAQIVIPTFVGLSGLAVAAAAWWTSRQAVQIAADAHRQAVEREERDDRAAFADTMIEFARRRKGEDGPRSLEIQRAAASLGEPAMLILRWFLIEHVTVRNGSKDGSDPQLGEELREDAQGQLVYDLTRRLAAWIRTNEFDTSSAAVPIVDLVADGFFDTGRVIRDRHLAEHAEFMKEKFREYRPLSGTFN